MSERLDKLHSYTQTGIDAWQVPGLAIAVAKDDAVVLRRGLG